MNNQRGMLTSLITIGAAGAAIYGITRGVQNGTFKRLPQTFTNALNNPQVKQLTKSLQNMTDTQNNQQISTPLQGEAASQNLQQQMGNNNQNNEI